MTRIVPALACLAALTLSATATAASGARMELPPMIEDRSVRRGRRALYWTLVSPAGFGRREYPSWKPRWYWSALKSLLQLAA